MCFDVSVPSCQLVAVVHSFVLFPCFELVFVLLALMIISECINGMLKCV